MSIDEMRIDIYGSYLASTSKWLKIRFTVSSSWSISNIKTGRVKVINDSRSIAIWK